ncbi:MAG: class I SAM-dependent methyltransferase [Planctomycetes bacterium]|nr:class I SAM-dependent methyltransferase [Planctomycetota bacterium]NUQ33789.1 class I SAM-dependent methyltransferase [Planctomycetaceae bacterium]
MPSNPNKPSPVDTAREIFAAAFKHHGPRVEALLWSGETSQRERFGIMCDIGDLRDARVLDVGCGFASLYDYLCERFGKITYTGIDITQEFLSVARERHSGIDVRLASIDTLGGDERWDYIFCSGIFNLAYGFRDLELNLKHMFERAQTAVAVNLLSAHSLGALNVEASYFDPADVVTLAARLSRSFTLRHDYRANDCTLYLYKRSNYPGRDVTPGNIRADAVKRPYA